eukprot:2494384-Pyramimonas_sp.AAC.2
MYHRYCEAADRQGFTGGGEGGILSPGPLQRQQPLALQRSCFGLCNTCRYNTASRLAQAFAHPSAVGLVGYRYPPAGGSCPVGRTSSWWILSS